MKVMVKRLLRQYGYPPDMQALAIELVLEQAKVFTEFEVETNRSLYYTGRPKPKIAKL
jgi:type I restriction enzyme R subunit